MPSEPEHRLAAHAAIARTDGVRFFAKGCRRCTKAEWGTGRYSPDPAHGRGTAPRERAGELVGADRMMTQIGFHGAARSRRNERTRTCVQQHGYRKCLRQIALQARQRFGVSLRAPTGYGHAANLGGMMSRP